MANDDGLGSEGQGSAVKLIVQVHDRNGDLVETRCKDDDLYLTNWGVLIAGMLQVAINTSYGAVFRGHNTSGSSYFCGSTWASFTNFANGCDYYGGDNCGRVLFGVSAVPPTLEDYKNGNNMLTVIPNAPTIVNVGSVMKIIFTATAAVENEVTLSEVAYQIATPLNGNNTVILTRDTFTPVTVPAGGSITVSFEYWLNGVPA